jgi:phosphohistidine phosphatase
MKLHLLRHGKTRQESASGRDYDRKLNQKGLVQCELLGDYFLGKKLKCETWISAAKRTRETFEHLTQKANLDNFSYREDLYLCSRDFMLELLWNHDGNHDLLIIGHNFGISDLASYLTDHRVELQTGGYICIDFKGYKWKEISRGLGTISDQFRPEVAL